MPCRAPHQAVCNFHPSLLRVAAKPPRRFAPKPTSLIVCRRRRDRARARWRARSLGAPDRLVAMSFSPHAPPRPLPSASKWHPGTASRPSVPSSPTYSPIRVAPPPPPPPPPLPPPPPPPALPPVHRSPKPHSSREKRAIFLSQLAAQALSAIGEASFVQGSDAAARADRDRHASVMDDAAFLSKIGSAELAQSHTLYSPRAPESITASLRLRTDRHRPAAVAQRAETPPRGTENLRKRRRGKPLILPSDSGSAAAVERKCSADFFMSQIDDEETEDEGIGRDASSTPRIVGTASAFESIPTPTAFRKDKRFRVDCDGNSFATPTTKQAAQSLLLLMR